MARRPRRGVGTRSWSSASYSEGYCSRHDRQSSEWRLVEVFRHTMTIDDRCADTAGYRQLDDVRELCVRFGT